MDFPSIVMAAATQGGGTPAASPNLIVMGGTSWDQTNGSSIIDNGSTLAYSSVGSSNVNINVACVALQIGATYRWSFTISNRTAGAIRLQNGTDAFSSRAANGDFTEDVTVTVTSKPQFRTVTSCTMTLSNISVIKL